MRNPFEYLDLASCIASGEIVGPPEVSMLIVPLANARQRTG
jgi:hypothetical protein